MTAGAGTLALVGAGEFLNSMQRVDQALLERAGGTRVAILPTASAPDGGDVLLRWAEMGTRHFQALGAEAEAVLALNRADCGIPENVEAVRRAHLVYFSGGKPGYLLKALRGTPLWGAVLSVLAAGGVLAGCSAGAMVLGGWIPDRPRAGAFSIWQPAFGLIPNSVLMPHFEELPGWVTRPLRWLRPRRSSFVGIDGGTALIGSMAEGDPWGTKWEVAGKGRVVVEEGGKVQTYRAGEAPARIG